jgi:hypothetical protein
MRAPDRYSASPFYSFVTVTTRPTPSLADALRAIWSWLRGTRPGWRETAKQARIVERLAEELADDEDRR